VGTQPGISDSHTAFPVTEKDVWLDPPKWYGSYVERFSYYMGLNEPILKRNIFGPRDDELGKRESNCFCCL